MDREERISHISFLLDEMRRYRANRWPGSGIVALVTGAVLYFGFAAPLWAAIGLGFLSGVAFQMGTDSSLTVVRIEYAKMASEFREETREAIERNPEPSGFFARLKYLDYS